jgi:hypothetical protein
LGKIVDSALAPWDGTVSTARNAKTMMQLARTVHRSLLRRLPSARKVRPNRRNFVGRFDLFQSSTVLG